MSGLEGEGAWWRTWSLELAGASGARSWELDVSHEAWQYMTTMELGARWLHAAQSASMVTISWTAAAVTVAVMLMIQETTALQCYHCYVKPPPRAPGSPEPEDRSCTNFDSSER